MPLISVIIPVYHEPAENLFQLHDRLCKVSAGISNYDFEFVFVDDGSTDDTPLTLHRIRESDPRVKILRFSRNFGAHEAVLAGLTYAHGDCFVNIAADLQDPPEFLPTLISKLEEGFHAVFAVRARRDDPWLKVKIANFYHRLMKRYAIPNYPLRGADFVLMRREVRNVLVNWRQKNTSIFMQLFWAGFKQAFIPYTKEKRFQGKSNWTFKKKIKLTVDSFVGFSFTPIRFISYAGMLFSLAGLIYAGIVVGHWAIWGNPVPGWSSMMVILLLVSGFQMVMLGVIGEYLWRVADQVRGAPPFIIEAAWGFEQSLCSTIATPLRGGPVQTELPVPLEETHVK